MCNVEIVSESVVYEDDDFVLRKVLWSDGGIQYELVILDSRLEADLMFYERDEYCNDKVAMITTKLWALYDPWNKLEVSHYIIKGFGLEEEKKFRELKDKAGEIRTPKDFIKMFLGILSPSLAELCGVIKGEEREKMMIFKPPSENLNSLAILLKLMPESLLGVTNVGHDSKEHEKGG